MKFHVYRAAIGFVLSPECMQAPFAVQSMHPPVCECGSVDLPFESVRQVLVSLAHDGYAIVAQREPVYAVMESICAERSSEIVE